MQSRAQIELSMLTRFAMLFFIVSLAALMLNLSTQEKAHLCSSQADSLSAAVASQISQVLSSPVEDERKVYALTNILAVGKEEYARYNINITNHIDSNKTRNQNYFTVYVAPIANPSCSGSRYVYYNRTTVSFISEATDKTKNARGDTVLTIDPSNPVKRSRYLVIIKCRPKIPGMQDQIFIENCKQENPAKCLNLQDKQIDECCGWALNDANNNVIQANCPT
ncbi:MAG: hypothetical protein ACP5O3_03555, partial [Candidatus Micrarchaeia archaeon]